MYKILFGVSGIWLGVSLASALFLEKWKVNEKFNGKFNKKKNRIGCNKW